MVTVKEITDIIEQLAPKKLAFNWDNVGLQVGSNGDEINKVLLCLDVNDEVINEAIEEEVQLIVAHHPLIFLPLKNILEEDYKGNIIHKAIKHNINIYIAHTNIDAAEKGLNAYIANKIRLNNLQVLDPISTQTYYKIVVFVPEEYEEKVANALSKVGAGHIGNYDHCTFRSRGQGTFRPLEGTNPFIGEKGEIVKTDEVKIETIVPKSYLSISIKQMIDAHPYEEVAYDIYKLENEEEIRNGIGRVGKLNEAVRFEELIHNLKETFSLNKCKAVGDLEDFIEKIAIVNGSGADYIKLASQKGCDLLVTGDIKYHDAQLAAELKLNLLDIGHYESEVYFKDLLFNYLEKEFIKKDINVNLLKTKTKNNPFLNV
ncbi:Nif3-like dinuclear metal center hexameric protein [Serpentinicella sp. ANB-PHB4]|uniref:Nif3-like dinuclear metal center hexameric protein n=1 Tax=Serpentinicella sp. ANB-PHB4 TaxID=3074076 RepID=UPI00285E7992|nr:Nif3-like dinuclear metal center hexameric protein [Serpentinicella sp. ANB-PHB4]MDR5658002.1 Nif3-like dinuclear metal center hexameric protein [Serpentinicella sp. ANB-PHB4]